MKIRLFSDVHVNFYESSEPLIEKLNSRLENVDENEILVIAGDVGSFIENDSIDPRYLDMLKYFRKRWKNKIILVPGNHEWYESQISMNTLNDMLSNECEKLGIEYLNKDTFKIGSYVFLGCTLWSHPSPKEWERIKHKYEKYMSYEDMKKLNQNHIEWLDKTLKKISESDTKNTVIVITHHLPTYKLITGKFNSKKYKSSNTSVANNLEWLLNRYEGNIDYWFCGHSHVSHMCTYNDTILYLKDRKSVV